VLRTLLQWAAQQGARRALLEVTEQNDGALALYREIGFTTAYAYHYRTLPA
jgi:ribosomal protein S18 acetylase RimI-like enzyme